MENLFDFFAVVGFAPRTFEENQKETAVFDDDCSYETKESLFNEPTFEAKIIDYYPHVPAEEFPNEIAILAMPLGAKLLPKKYIPKSPTFHTFLVIKEDGARIYGSSLIFYEEVNVSVQTFQTEKLTIENTTKPNLFYSPFLSHKLFIGRTDKEESRSNSNSLPRRLSSDSTTTNSTGNLKDLCSSNKNTDLCIPKALVFTSSLPLVYSSEILLRNIWKSFVMPKRLIRLEDILYNSLSLALPPRGKILNVAIFDEINFCVKRPNTDELPFFDYPIQTLFNYSSVENILKLLTALLTEKQLLLISSTMDRLMLFAESLTALIFPFRWECPFCPILPHSQFKFLEAPVPWLMGIVVENLSAGKISQFNAMGVYHIDTDRFEYSYDLPTFPLADKIAGNLKQLIKNSKNTDKENNNFLHQKQISDLQEDSHIDEKKKCLQLHRIYFKGLEFNNAIREIFLSIFVELFYSYEKYILTSTTRPRGTCDNFDKISFLSEQPESLLPFLAAFLDTQMFTSFIDSKIQHIVQQQSNMDDEITLFDAKIKMFCNGQKKTDTKRQNFDTEIEKDILTSENFEFVSFPLVSRSSPNFEDNHDRTFTSALRSFPHLDKNKFLPLANSRRLCAAKSKSQVHATKNISQSEEETKFFITKNSSHSSAKITVSNDRNFVDQLLKEAKSMLIFKMGKEAVILGHGDTHTGILGVEENTLISQFCDLLEMAFSHGLKHKQGKSSFWKFMALSSQQTLSSSEDEQKQNVRPDGCINQSANPNNRNRSYDTDDCDISSTHPIDELKWELENLSKQMLDRVENLFQNKTVRSLLLKDAIEAEEKFRPSTTPTIKIVRYNPNKKQEQQKSSTSAVFDESKPPVPTTSLIDPPRHHRAMKQHLSRNSNKSSHQSRNRSASIRDFVPSWSTNSLVSLATSFHAKQAKYVLPSSSVSEVAGGDTQRSYEEENAKNRGHLRRQHQRKSRTARSLSRANSPNAVGTNEIGGENPEQNYLTPLPVSIGYDIKNLLGVSEIKTDVAFARAFVRLALERKLLYSYLKSALSNQQLLRRLYKRHAFLRNDDFRDEFLCHLLSLNAADFHCFTNTFITITIRYEVLMFANISPQYAPLVSIQLSGLYGSTVIIHLPESLQFTFDHKNLGILSNLRVGHAFNVSHRNTKWFLDYVIVRNNFTGQIYRFPCGRWFGRGIEDGAMERVLFPSVISDQSESATAPDDLAGETNFGFRESTLSSIATLLSPKRTITARGRTGNNTEIVRHKRSQSSDNFGSELQFLSNNVKKEAELLEQRLGSAVNAMIKHLFHHDTGGTVLQGVGRTGNARLTASLTPLLCGLNGLVPSLNDIFSFQLKQGFFQQVFPWDYITKTFLWFRGFFREGKSNGLTKEQRSLIIYAYNMVVKIEDKIAVGKDGKFSCFILQTLKDHILCALLPLMQWTPISTQMFEPGAFFRDPQKLSHLSKILSSLNGFEFNLESNLTYEVTKG